MAQPRSCLKILEETLLPNLTFEQRKMEILGAIAFPIAAYQTVEKFYEFAIFINKKIKTYTEAPDAVIEVQILLSDLEDGELRRNMERTEWIFDQEDVPKFTKNRMSNSLQQLKKQLRTIGIYLAECYDNNGQLRRNMYTWHYSRHLNNALTVLETWRTEFWTELERLTTESNLPSALLLSKQHFRPKFGKWNVDFASGTGPIKFGRASFSQQDNEREVEVFIEQVQKLEADGKPPASGQYHQLQDRENLLEEAKSIAQCLARKLQYSTTGIPRCLGYRSEFPSIELVFEIPSRNGNPHTLRHILINGRSGRNHDILAPWEYRYRLARDLVIAVYSINAAGFVHKSIRPDSIVVLSKKSTPPENSQNADAVIEEKPTPPRESRDTGTLFEKYSTIYMMEWRMLRRQEMASSGQGDDDWTRNFYRHPNRQGLQPQRKYETEHDVYSLGVCLLEIGLWQSLIVEKNGIPSLSDYFLAVAEEHAGCTESDFKSMDPKTRPEMRYNGMAPLCMSGKLVGIFEEIARARLPQLMGTAYADLVVKCLNNIEGGFGDPKTFTGKNKMENFQKLILNDSTIGLSMS
jgi:hypothetical protein